MLNREFITFCIIGVLNTVINYLVFLFFFKSIGLVYYVSGAIGFISGAFSGFFLNRKFTFRTETPTASGLSKYILVQLFCLGIHIAVQAFSAEILNVPKIYSQLFGIVITTFLNYFISRKMVFNR